MLIYVVLFLVLILIVVLNMKWTTQYSTIDNSQYVLLNKEDNKDVSKQIDIIREKIGKLISYLNNSNNQKNKNGIKRLINKLKGTSWKEIAPDEGVAYSLNKGDEIGICMRNKENNSLENKDQTTLFVCLS